MKLEDEVAHMLHPQRAFNDGDANRDRALIAIAKAYDDLRFELAGLVEGMRTRK